MVDLIRRVKNHSAGGPVGDYDGSSNTEALYLSVAPVTGLQVYLYCPGTEEVIDCLVYLEAFWGASWTGTQWSGGAWTAIWAGATSAMYDSALPAFFSKECRAEFDPPMELPELLRQTILAPAGHAKAGQRIIPNTHNATEVAGQTDLRLRLDEPDLGTPASWVVVLNAQTILLG